MINILELVFKQKKGIKADLFTTSKVIAECTNVKHHAVQQMIIKYEKELSTMGKLAFEMRPNESNQNEKIYKLNEQQATLLITFMKNTPVVVEFKKELVKQFYKMREELNNYKVQYAKSIPVQKDLHQAIKESPRYKDSEKLNFMYPTFNKLIYKMATGRKLNKENNKNSLSPNELAKYKSYELIVIGLLETGADYDQVKNTLEHTTKAM